MEQEKKTMLCARIDAKLHDRFKSVCSFLGVRMQDVIVEMVGGYVDNGLASMVKWAKERGEKS